MSSGHTFCFKSLKDVLKDVENKELSETHYSSSLGHASLITTNEQILGFSYFDSFSDRDLIKKKFLHTFRKDKFIENKDREQDLHKRIAQNRPLTFLIGGTEFQLKVWQYLSLLLPEKMTTYQEIAQVIGHPGALRAVGTAVGANPVAFFLPCHRVIRRDGTLGGYRWGIKKKQTLLRAEGLFVEKISIRRNRSVASLGSQ